MRLYLSGVLTVIALCLLSTVFNAQSVRAQSPIRLKRVSSDTAGNMVDRGSGVRSTGEVKGLSCLPKTIVGSRCNKKEISNRPLPIPS